jgi:hypothetical protein
MPLPSPRSVRSLRAKAALAALALASMSTLSTVAHAAPTAADKKAADALFKEGREHVDSGDYAVACAKFLASYKLDPLSSTLLNLADCHQRAGQTATAYDRFQEAVALAKKLGRADREKTARDRLEALEPKLTKVEVRLAEQDKSQATVTRDGAPLSREELQGPVRVDPGPHTFFVTAPGKKSFSTTVSATEEGKTYAVDVPALASEGDEPAPPPKTGGGGATKPPSTDDPGSGRKTVALIVGGAGLVIAGVGGYFGIRTFSKWSDSEARCDASGCDREGIDLASDAKTSGFISTIGLAAGGAIFATGVILYLTAPGKTDKPARSTYLLPAGGPGSLGLVTGGTF